MPDKPKLGRRIKNLSLAAVASLAGLVSVIIVFSALFLGLWLDARFLNTRGPFTIGLLVASVPVSLYVMLRMVFATVGRIVPQPPQWYTADTPDAEEE